MRLRTLLPGTLALVLTGSLVSTAVAAAPAAKGGKRKPPPSSAPTWAPAATATVHPGVMTYTAGGQCTANFIFTDGARVLIGQAAHCAGTGTATETDGCDSGSLPLGTKVEVDGASQPGTLVYSSWIAMQKAGEKDPETCAYNDFALIELAAADVAVTNPSVPVYGGPTALGAGTTFFEDVYSYGNSSLRLGLSPLSPKRGVSLGDTPDGWSTDVYTVTPGIPGDSGSGFLDSTGRALGTLSTVQIFPLAGSNGVSNLAKELAYAKTHGQRGATLAVGTEPFTPDALG